MDVNSQYGAPSRMVRKMRDGVRESVRELVRVCERVGVCVRESERES